MSDRLRPPVTRIATGSSEDSAAHRLCVLTVEDDLSARWLMRSALKNACDFLSATTGEEALELYRRHQPQVVILDFCLPNKRGDDILKDLLDADPAAYVVVMSGSENMEALQAMLAAGACAMLVKPFEKADLLRAVLGPRERGVSSLPKNEF
ncbi:MAG: response regulator [Alphaproteobacteria bacterium]|nr:response regulator [Alphaproteobacteria bacterium]